MEQGPLARPAEDDRPLVERARAGDTEAFRALVERHRDRAYGLALRITRSPADAEDAAQEAFVRAWRALPGFRGEAAFGTWLHRIVARRALDQLAARRSCEARNTGLEAVEQVAAADAPRDAVLARRLERLSLCLSAAQRAALALFYGEEQSVSDIATALGMPENTVKTHLRRARAALREGWLREEGAEP